MQYEDSKLVYQGDWNTVISNNFIRNTKLSSQARFIYITLKSFTTPYNSVAFPSLPYLENLIGLSINTVIKYLNELEKKGYMEKKQGRNKQGEFENNRYVLHETPIQVTHSPTHKKNKLKKVTHSPTHKKTETVKLNPRGIPSSLGESHQEEEEKESFPPFLIKKLKKYGITNKQVDIIFRDSTIENISLQIDVLEYYITNNLKISNIPKKLFAMIREKDPKPNNFISSKEETEIEAKKQKSKEDREKNEKIRIKKENEKLEKKMKKRKTYYNSEKYDILWNKVKKQLINDIFTIDSLFIQDIKENIITINSPNALITQLTKNKATKILKEIEKIENKKYKLIFNTNNCKGNLH